jgi:transposase
MKIRLGIDVACRAAHQASCADEAGEFLFSGRRFRSTVADLEALWAALPPAAEEVLVVMEPTRNAWAPLAAWLAARGAKVALIPTRQSADLRDYYHKHTKNDRLDSRLLARLPLLHPEGLRLLSDPGPAGALRRAVRRRSTLVRQRTAIFQQIDALLELMGPHWADVLGTGQYNKSVLSVLERTGADPQALARLGLEELTDLLITSSRGLWRAEHAEAILAAAATSRQLWAGGGLDFTELAADLASEARMARTLNEEITALDQRAARLYQHADPGGIIASGPGIGPVLAAGILGRLGDPDRFTNLRAVRAFSGLIPALEQSGTSQKPGRLTKAGDPGLRTALFNAADKARKADPTLAARYHDLVITKGKHHNAALCTIAALLLTRLAGCWRNGTPYQLRDTDGHPISPEEGRTICATTHHVTQADRAKTTRPRTAQRLKTGRRSKESQSAPATGPSTPSLRKTTAQRLDLR